MSAVGDKHQRRVVKLLTVMVAPLLFLTLASSADAETAHPIPEPIGVDTSRHGGEEDSDHNHDSQVLEPALPPETKPDQPTQSPTLKPRLDSLSIGFAADLDSCDVSVFATSGQELLDAISSEDIDCVGYLFYRASTTQKLQTFTEGNIITVAEEAHQESLNYNGTDPYEYLRKLFFWLQAAYFYNNRELLTPDNKEATRLALDAFFSNSHVFDKTVENAKVVSYAAANINNALVGPSFMPLAMDLFNRYDESFEAVGIWGSNFASIIWTVLYACAIDTACRSAEHDANLVTTLGNFIHDNISWLDRPSTDYHLHNTGYLLGAIYLGKSEPHFTALQGTLEAQLGSIFTSFGPLKKDIGRRAYLQALTAVNQYGVCAVYSVCDKQEEIIEAVLKDRIICPEGTLFMWAQDMNQAQLDWACSSLAVRETVFHDTLDTKRVPVSPDDNDQLRMIVFNDRREWNIYGYALHGVNTNNGGIYLEHDPAKEDDVATFFAYEDVGARPVFDIWNLQHEYVHYLDGRFIKKGDFGDTIDTGRMIWYVEGVAEYISKGECNDAAVNEAGSDTYAISTIFQNDYSSGSSRVYRWGYLAVRFMAEEHSETFFQMLELFRNGEYQEYRDTMVDQWVNEGTYDSEFADWLLTVTSSGCVTDSTRPPSPVEPIDIGDIQGNDQVGNDACEASLPNDERIKAGIAKCLETVTGGGELSLEIYVPQGLVDVTLEITLRHGDGNAHLFHRYDSRPNGSTYDHASTNSGTEQTISVDSVQPGWNYVHVRGKPYFNNVTLLARYLQGETPNLAPVAQANGPYTATAGEAVTLSSLGTFDPDGTVVGYLWDFGTGDTSVTPNPSYVFASPGEYNVSLTVTDDRGDQHTDFAEVTVTEVSIPDHGVPNACEDSAPAQANEIFAEVPMCLREVTNGGQLQMHFYVSEENVGKTLEVNMGHGTGDAVLLYRFGQRPNDTVYDASSGGPGTRKTIVVPAIQRTWHYVHVRAATEFSRATLSVRIVDPDDPAPPTETGACASGPPDNQTRMTLGEPMCLPQITNAGELGLMVRIPRRHVGKTLRITLTGGTGDATLLYRARRRPTTAINHGISDSVGTEKTIVVPVNKGGRHHIHVRGEPAFSGVTLLAEIL